MIADYWTAAATKFSEEQRAAHHVERQGFDFYLPIILAKKGSSLRREYLFPGYIFIKIKSGWESLMSTRGIHRMFLCSGTPTRMRSDDIDVMRSREGSDGLIRLEPEVTVGTRVRIESGSFKDVLGTVQSMSARDRCVVLLSIMERAVSVSLSVSMVKAI